jgi:hypothetical protein
MRPWVTPEENSPSGPPWASIPSDSEDAGSGQRDEAGNRAIERMRRNMADAICDRYGLPRARCESAAGRTARGGMGGR